MASIQFYGLENVLTAAENIKCSRWAVFCGRQLLFKYTDNDQAESIDFLSRILTDIEHSQAVYTLKFFEDAVKIKENTPCDASFNFRLVDEETRAEREKTYNASSNAVLNEIKALNQRLDRLEQPEEEEEEEPKGLNGFIAGILKEPEKLETLLGLAGRLLGITKPQAPAGALGNVPSKDDDTRIFEAIQRLRANDPQLTEHLEKLALMSETDKSTFKMLIGMLNKM